MHLSVTILTPERTVLEAHDVDYVVAPGAAGDVGILPEHGPLVTGLRVGVVQVQRDSGHEPFAVSGGLLEVVDNRVQILAQTAEPRDEIDAARARSAHQRALERLAAKDEQIDTARAEAALARALNRLHVAGGEE